jgi:hypothetical protein
MAPLEIVTLTMGMAWAEEDHPGQKVVGDLLKPVRHPRCREQEVAGVAGNALFTPSEHAAARRDDIGFVLIVRVLVIDAPRRVKLGAEIAALEERDEPLRLDRQPPCCLCQSDAKKIIFMLGHKPVLSLRRLLLAVSGMTQSCATSWTPPIDRTGSGPPLTT